MALPITTEAWPKFEGHRLRDLANDHYDAATEQLRKRIGHKPFVWPNRTMYFFCDVHADADAWRSSLIASGGVRWHGAGDDDYELTAQGRDALFVIAGDCFDKGPSNLRLLRAIKLLIDKGAEVEILAGVEPGEVVAISAQHALAGKTAIGELTGQRAIAEDVAARHTRRNCGGVSGKGDLARGGNCVGGDGIAAFGGDDDSIGQRVFAGLRGGGVFGQRGAGGHKGASGKQACPDHAVENHR
jgi:hypothetical protein